MKSTKTFLFAVGAIGFILVGSAYAAYRPVIDLGTLGGSSSVANSINDNGQIVGWAYNSSGGYHACLFDKTGGGGNNIDLGTFGGNCSEAYPSITAARLLARLISVPAMTIHACLFDPTGGGANIDLGTLGGELQLGLFHQQQRPDCRLS